MRMLPSPKYMIALCILALGKVWKPGKALLFKAFTVKLVKLSNMISLVTIPFETEYPPKITIRFGEILTAE